MPPQTFKEGDRVKYVAVESDLLQGKSGLVLIANERAYKVKFDGLELSYWVEKTAVIRDFKYAKGVKVRYTGKTTGMLNEAIVGQVGEVITSLPVGYVVDFDGTLLGVREENLEEVKPSHECPYCFKPCDEQESAQNCKRCDGCTNKPLARRFYLRRNDDESGVSGRGLVVVGTLYSKGDVTLSWLTEYRSVGVYPSLHEMIAIHGHGGKTVVEWIDTDASQDSDDMRVSISGHTRMLAVARVGSHE